MLLVLALMQGVQLFCLSQIPGGSVGAGGGVVAGSGVVALVTWTVVVSVWFGLLVGVGVGVGCGWGVGV